MNKLNRLPVVLALAAACIACSDDSSPKDAGKEGGGPDQMMPDTLAPDMGPRPNSGALCTGASASNPQGTCKNSKDLCVKLNYTSAYGMCLMECNPGTTCPTPPGQYASQCAIQVKLSSSKIVNVCGWFCEYGAARYYCPNENGDYECWVYDSTKPNNKFCRPK
jgi:hypothetical protein